jgi:hypothetical protein
MLEVKACDKFWENDYSSDIPVLEVEDTTGAIADSKDKLKDVDIVINENNVPTEYLFTEYREMRSFKDFAKGLLLKYGRQKGMNYIMEKFSVEKSLDVNAFIEALDFLLDARIKRDSFSEYTDQNLIDDKDSFLKVYGQTISDLCKNQEALECISSEKETRQTFIAFLNDIIGDYGDYKHKHNKTAIESGQEIEKRRVAVYKIAELLGMQELVEPAYIVKLKLERASQFMKKAAEFEGPDYKEVNGVIRAKVRGGKSLASLENNTTLSKLSLAKHIDPVVYKQASDLMLLDYICGNLDRADTDLSCQLAEINGFMHITGLVGTDNIYSIGNIEATAFGRSISCDSIKFISATGARALQELDVKRMLLHLNSLYFSEAEINHLVNRVKMITQSLREGRIRVVNDNVFNRNMDISYVRRLHRGLVIKGTSLDAIENKVRKNIQEKVKRHKRRAFINHQKHVEEKKISEALNPPEMANRLKRGD